MILSPFHQTDPRWSTSCRHRYQGPLCADNPQLSKVLCLKLGVSRDRALLASPAAQNSMLLSIAVCTGTKNVLVFYVRTGIKCWYTDWCRRACRPSVHSPTVTQATTRDDGTSVHQHVWGAFRKFDDRIALFASSNISISLAVLSFLYIGWSVSTDLIFLWHLGLGCTWFHMFSDM